MGGAGGAGLKAAMTPLFFTPMALGDRPEMDRLLFHAFGPERKSMPSYALRQGLPLDRLSWVARSPEGQVLGCLRFWRVALEGQDVRCVLLGPLAVDLAYRGAGVAGQLVQFGLARTQDLGFDLCFVVGEPRFYRRFGFTSAAWSGVRCAAPIPRRRLQVRELTPGVTQKLRGPQSLTAFPAG